MALQFLVGQGLITEASRSHLDALHSVGLPWTSDQSDRDTTLYVTTHNTHNRKTSMPSTGFETAVRGSERPQTHALDRAASAIGLGHVCVL
jgi:hypothetical protein